MSWFESHLNWSLVLGIFIIPLAVWTIVLIIFGLVAYSAISGMSYAGEEYFIILWETMVVPFFVIYVLLLIAQFVFSFFVTWWYLGQKARSKWLSLLFFAPFGLIILFLLENQAIGYGGDFGDYLTREPVTDQRADTRQYGTPDDWRPKELDYSPAKDARYIAYGGDVKGVRDVGVPSGETTAKPPAEVQEKAVENVPADAPPVSAQEKAVREAPAEAMEKTPEETIAEAMGEVPVEAAAAG